ncbi:MAG: tRNA uridine-5-carboxymethylaminomethyl(34) synthesis GTPase MnmE [Meiothermus sp.]|uniref:tRNA uridine-5-carboxymethylaminomethyl(34) synthesis GTPase MnmE n=1 Tax=Meiothermus sp. TaxID=1955249 RepID=UPI0025F35BB8|nr:tRNA uridine-5-carboxymethylaminomethyl(34) synthesis GTPase MnmE [Meiothermus sp.]MCS7057512.1 tRNA uridine-5-carboxymethylaminomethyl(34) synthesis GTPase MnmE [Meiothermus sp.]MCS7193701.1 tRNA uridine-5-carboxymethylaminomethyl(34) synthesis GTPase MnmE [Meiothermus sp.]MCX7740088.1 tRNA uridine-5-carboxymethylaminomethyl(34) synthesis GTPase MnmE [Meiothermus sp.]MDW8089944.1 tRNA uridine-5-carboxymethylaminomethyl(34) synthesis GTPase MnmE [Meiothermus sp.]MDW8481631.1 tRNA uridine-5-
MGLPSLQDIIAAIATPPGRGAVGVVRVSGPGSLELVGKLWQGKDPSRLPGGRFTFGKVCDPRSGEVVDEALLLVFRAPHSYTGQDSAELQTHGSPAVLRRVLQVLFQNGARPAQPGEFTLRAYLNGRMDLAQAEAVLSLVEAESEAARRQALRGLSAGLSKRIRALSEGLFDLLAHIQAWLDYPEEGVEPVEVAVRLEPVLTEVRRLLATAPAGRIASRGARVALVGAPNAGKSSLLNALLGYERAIVTPIPGTTRDYLEAPLEVGGVPVTAIDTAGVRETDDPVERSGVERALQIAQEADLVLYLADQSQPKPPPPPLPWPRTLRVATKADLPPAWQDEAFLPVSSLTGMGLEALRQEVHRRLLGEAPQGEIWISNERHVEALRRAEAHLQAALEAPLDLAGLSIEMALEALSEILGKNVSEEVIERVFRNFCVGK